MHLPGFYVVSAYPPFSCQVALLTLLQGVHSESFSGFPCFLIYIFPEKFHYFHDYNFLLKDLSPELQSNTFNSLWHGPKQPKSKMFGTELQSDYPSNMFF